VEFDTPTVAGCEELVSPAPDFEEPPQPTISRKAGIRTRRNALRLNELSIEADKDA